MWQNECLNLRLLRSYSNASFHCLSQPQTSPEISYQLQATLKFSQQEVLKGIYFENGIIVGSSTNDPREIDLHFIWSMISWSSL